MRIVAITKIGKIVTSGILIGIFFVAAHSIFFDAVKPSIVRAAVTPIYWIPASGSCSIPEYKSQVACEQTHGEWVETVAEYCEKSYTTSENWNSRDMCEASANTYTPPVEHAGYCTTWTGRNNDDETTCKTYFHEWHPAWTENAKCAGPLWSGNYAPLGDWDCLAAKRGRWHDRVLEHCADGTTKGRDACLAVGTWTGIPGRCTDGVSPDMASCNLAAAQQVESGAIDAGNFCRVKGGSKRCSELNFSWSPANNSSPSAYTINNAAPYGKYWPSTSILSAPGNSYCVDNKCTDVPNPSFSVVKETPYTANGYVNGKLVTFQIKGRTKEYMFYRIARDLSWDSVKDLPACECKDNDGYESCGLSPYYSIVSTYPRDCYDQYTIQVTAPTRQDATKYGISKATTFTIPSETGCDRPLQVRPGVFACASWKFDRLENSPIGSPCSCDATNENLDCKLVFNGNYAADGSECYDTYRSIYYSEPGYGTRYSRFRKVKRFEIDPFRSTPIAQDELAAVQSRCFGNFDQIIVEEKSSETTEYTIPVYNYTRYVDASTRAEPNDAVTCRVKLTSQYGRNVDQNGKGYAGEIFQTPNFIPAPRVDYFSGSTNTAAPGATNKAVKVYRKDHAAVTFSWSVSSAQKVRLIGDNLPGGWEGWSEGKQLLQSEVTVSDLSYGTHTYKLLAVNSAGVQSNASIITVEVIDPQIIAFVDDGEETTFNGKLALKLGIYVQGATNIKIEHETSAWYGATNLVQPKGSYEPERHDDASAFAVDYRVQADPGDTRIKILAWNDRNDGGNMTRIATLEPPIQKHIQKKTAGRVNDCKFRAFAIESGTVFAGCELGAAAWHFTAGGAAATGIGTVASFLIEGGLLLGCGAAGIGTGIVRQFGQDGNGNNSQKCEANPDYSPTVMIGISVPIGGTGSSSGSSSSENDSTTVIGSDGQPTGSIGDVSALKDQGWKMSDLPPSLQGSGLQWPLPTTGSGLGDLQPASVNIPEFLNRAEQLKNAGDPFLPGGRLRSKEELPAQVKTQPPPELSPALAPGLSAPSPTLSIFSKTEKNPLKLSATQKGGLSSNAKAPAELPAQSSSSHRRKPKNPQTPTNTAPPPPSTPPTDLDIINRMENPAGGSVHVKH